LEKAGSLSCWRHLPLNLKPGFHQTIGRERRERVSHHNWSGDAFVNSRRRVNSVGYPSSLTCRKANIDVYQ